MEATAPARGYNLGVTLSMVSKSTKYLIYINSWCEKKKSDSSNILKVNRWNFVKWFNFELISNGDWGQATYWASLCSVTTFPLLNRQGFPSLWSSPTCFAVKTKPIQSPCRRCRNVTFVEVFAKIHSMIMNDLQGFQMEGSHLCPHPSTHTWQLDFSLKQLCTQDF